MAVMMVLLAALATAQAPQRPIVGGASPAVSRDGKRIAFLSDRSGASQVYVIGVDGTGEQQVTRSPEPKGPAIWSANGRQLTFTIFATDITRLFDIDIAGGEPRQIGMVPGRMVALAPDRKRVVYSMGSWTANRLITADLNGGHPRQITDSASIAWNMKWSPDGKEIAFTGRGDGGGLAVFIVESDGSGRHQVTHLAREKGGAQLPAWAPDGRRLAVQVSNKTDDGGIWIIDVADGSARELGAHAPGYIDEIPTWFPDGKRIAFQSNRSGRTEVWTMNADGSGLQQVTGKRP